MPIYQQTPKQQVDAFLDAKVRRINRQLVRTLSYVGEACRNRTKVHKYQNQTGNLESSTGYVVVVNGSVVNCAGFDVVKSGSEGAQGGKSYALSLVSKFPTGICLIVVAGMKYAHYVSDKGLDVLDSAEKLAQRLVPQMLKQLDLSF